MKISSLGAELFHADEAIAAFHSFAIAIAPKNCKPPNTVNGRSW